MRHTLLIASLLWTADAGEPTALSSVGPIAPLTFRASLVRGPAPPCTGPLAVGSTPCAVGFKLGTAAAVTALDLLLPMERRLVLLSDGSRIPVALRRLGQPTTAGPLITGFSADPTFIGLGPFDMRSP